MRDFNFDGFVLALHTAALQSMTGRAAFLALPEAMTPSERTMWEAVAREAIRVLGEPAARATQREPRDFTLIPPAPEAPGREARAGTRLGVEPERGPSSTLTDCPCGDHERSRACCAWACSDLHTPEERAAAFHAETMRLAASARTPLPPPPRSVAGAAPRAPLTAWVASWVLPCEFDVPKLTYHMHRHVRHGYQVITLPTFASGGVAGPAGAASHFALYHCGRLVRTGRVAELVEYADTIADQETP